MDYIRSYEFQKKWLKLRKQILIRDNNTCQICGSYEKLRGNHIKRYRNYPTLRFEPTNIIIICKACDMRYVVRREEQWESYFNFNLATRGFIEDKLTLCY